jgi:hypothetical protein
MMAYELSNSAHFSQIETDAPPLRVVLLGASNLTLSFARLIASSRAMFARPLDVFVAMGFGRSYGQESRFFGKKFSGILQSEIWKALARATPLETVAIVADVGNDLAYEAPVDEVQTWMTTTFDRLAEHNARVVLNNLPIESLRGVGGLRYRAMRSLIFPRCRVPHGAMLARAEALSRGLTALAAERKIPVFAGEKSWYGLDPIHPRRCSSGFIWQRMLGELAGPCGVVDWTSPRRRDARLLRRVQRSTWLWNVRISAARESSIELSDGTRIALF